MGARIRSEDIAKVMDNVSVQLLLDLSRMKAMYLTERQVNNHQTRMLKALREIVMELREKVAELQAAAGIDAEAVQNLCERCTKDGAQELHECPAKLAEGNGSFCNCCEVCETECRDNM